MASEERAMVTDTTQERKGMAGKDGYKNLALQYAALNEALQAANAALTTAVETGRKALHQSVQFELEHVAEYIEMLAQIVEYDLSNPPAEGDYIALGGAPDAERWAARDDARARIFEKVWSQPPTIDDIL